MTEPDGFISYARSDDENDFGALAKFHERLESEVRAQTGNHSISIFFDQDSRYLPWGENWDAQIKRSLSTVRFFIPILTPSYFQSSNCHEEYDLFRKREEELGRKDLILPIYYIKCDELEILQIKESNEWAKELAKRTHVDWRDLRFKFIETPGILEVIKREFAEIASRIKAILDALKTVNTPSLPVLSADFPVPSPDGVGASQPSLQGKSDIPNTKVVDAMHQGDFSTISEAIASANPGDRIFVRPGNYKERLVLDKPVQIIGLGNPGDVLVEIQNYDVILFKTSNGTVRNIKLRQAGGEGNWKAVRILQGRLMLEDCDISSQSGSCVAIYGRANPQICRNQIHDGKAAGVFVSQNSQGTIQDNDIYANAGPGLVITRDSHPKVMRNRIHDEGESCNDIYIDEEEDEVLVSQQSHSGIRDHNIDVNVQVGSVMTGGDKPFSSRIYKGKQAGVLVLNNGRGILEENDIFTNNYAGVEIREGADPTLRRNRIHSGKGSGIFTHTNGLGTIEENEIFANAEAGVEISHGGNPTLQRNRIYRGKVGIYIHTNGLGQIEDNDIYENVYAGVDLTNGSNPTFRHNRIKRNKSVAVRAYDRGDGTFESNDLRDNVRGAWDIAPGCNIKRENNLE
ncbi:right-handed parallel beta-helix repeat-containing protein [Candidatus Acetothermia bacterium]|nr:right-handed parallel beta-helix repeat-containing protein [Candidatus Acetothermia bacterium]